MLRGLTPVAVGVFHLDGQLGKGFPKARDEHDGVKAKAIRPHGCAGDLAHSAAHGNERLGVVGVAHGHEGADQGGAAVVDVDHLFEQSAHVVVVAFLVAKLGGVVRGLHAR